MRECRRRFGVELSLEEDGQIGFGDIAEDDAGWQDVQGRSIQSGVVFPTSTKFQIRDGVAANIF